MALPRLRALSDPDPDDAIPSPRADPEYATAAALASAFNERTERLRQERHRLILELHFENRPARQNSPADQELWQKLMALRALPPVSPSPSPQPAASSASPAINRALAVLAGQPVAPKANLQAQIAEIDRLLAALNEGSCEQDAIVTAIVERLSAKIAEQLAPRWNALVIEMFRAAQELARATRRFRDYRAEIIRAGITGNSTILRAPNVRTPLMLGDEADWNSEIAGWRRLLESWGLL